MFNLKSWVKHFTTKQESVEIERPVYGFLRPKKVVKNGLVTTVLEEVVSDEFDVRKSTKVKDYALANLLEAGVPISEVGSLTPNGLESVTDLVDSVVKINDQRTKVNNSNVE